MIKREDLGDQESHAPIPDQGLFQAILELGLQNYLAKMFALLHPRLGLRRVGKGKY
jgi:hypothetical protein